MYHWYAFNPRFLVVTLPVYHHPHRLTTCNRLLISIHALWSVKYFIQQRTIEPSFVPFKHASYLNQLGFPITARGRLFWIPDERPATPNVRDNDQSTFDMWYADKDSVRIRINLVVTRSMLTHQRIRHMAC